MTAVMEKPEIRQLGSPRLFRSEQSWHWEEVLELKVPRWNVKRERGGQELRYLTGEVDEHRLRIRIEVNAHDFQSSARLERWDGDRWHQVAFRHGVELESVKKRPDGLGPLVSYAQTSVGGDGLDALHKDRRRLINEAVFVITGRMESDGPD